MTFTLGFLAASILWGIAAACAYRVYLRRMLTALNLPAASTHADVTNRLRADKGFKRGPWR